MLDKALFCAIITVLGGGVDALAARAIPKTEFGMQDNDTRIGEIYRAYCRPTGKSYIGQTITPLTRRQKNHELDARCNRKTMAFHHALRKYGEDAFVWETLCTACCESALKTLEAAYIEVFNTISPHGYNLRSGGWGGGAHSPETRAKMSAAAFRVNAKRRGVPLTDEHRAKMSAALAGEKHPNYGRITPDDVRAKISETNKKTFSRPEVLAYHREKMKRPELRQKISAAAFRRWANPEFRAKMTVIHRANGARRRAGNSGVLL